MKFVLSALVALRLAGGAMATVAPPTYAPGDVPAETPIDDTPHNFVTGFGIHPIAGYLPRTNVTEFLEKDLIQKELEDLIGDETCESFALAKDFVNKGKGQYFLTIPTKTTSISGPYDEMQKYYGKDDFMTIWIDKAIKKTKTNFKRGNANFKEAFIPPTVPTPDSGQCVGFEEVLKKGLSYGSTLIEMYQLMQEAIDLAHEGCWWQKNNCTDAVRHWDAAAAIYVGSLEGKTGHNSVKGNYGKAPYALADKRCRNFCNCGPNNGEYYDCDGAPKYIQSPWNTKILAYFAAGSHAAYMGDWAIMGIYLQLISNASAGPLLQGTYRYYYRLSDLEFGPNSFSTFDKELGEGAAFIFPILPKLWACSTRGEKRAYAQSRVGGGPAGNSAIDFLQLQLAFECNYQCLGIKCEHVGSLYDGNFPDPKPNYVNCDDEDNGSANQCAKQKGSRKKACKLYVGKPGIKGRDKVKFHF